MVVLTRRALLPALLLAPGCAFDAQLESMHLDLATWSADPCADVDGDGTLDVILHAQVARGDAPGDSEYRTWVLSGRDLSPLFALPQAPSPFSSRFTDVLGVVVGDEPRLLISEGLWTGGTPTGERAWFVSMRDGEVEFAPIVQSDLDQEPGAPPCLPGWRMTHLIQPLPSGGEGLLMTDVAVEQALPPSMTSPAARVAVESAQPELSQLQPCGDLDADGTLDWLGLRADPPEVGVVSGRDLSLLRTLTLSSWRYATVATGGSGMGDLDGDGTPDWLVGLHVSQSDERLEPRTCRTGLLSLVSGADLSVLATLERTSFLAGPARDCPVVAFPD